MNIQLKIWNKTLNIWQFKNCAKKYFHWNNNYVSTVLVLFDISWKILRLIMNFVESLVSIALGKTAPSTVGVKPITRQAICQPDSTPACRQATCILFLSYFLLVFLISLVYLFRRGAKVSGEVCDSVEKFRCISITRTISFGAVLQIWNVATKICSFRTIDLR